MFARLARHSTLFLIAAMFGLVAAACGGATDTAATDDSTQTSVPTEDSTAVAQDDGSEGQAEPATDTTADDGSNDQAEPATDSTATEPAEESSNEVSELFAGDFVDLNGEAIDLASFEGQDVVLWFWAPW